MKIKKNYIVSVLVCAVLFLASCAEETLVDNPHAQNALRTVSVDLGMPQGKPAYGDGTDSRAQMADTTATGYRLSFDTAETGKPDASRARSNNWIDGDRLLLHIVASNEDQTTQTTEGMLTLTYSDSKWSLDAMNSYTKYGASFVAYNSAQPKLLITDDETDIDLANLKMHVDEKIGMSANVTATLVYAPHMKWGLTEGSVTLVVDETASTYEKWEWTNTNSRWTTPYARLRVNTGAEGDVVTLTSSAFDSAWEDEPTEGIYTATTDDQGNAYFYGITNGDAALTDNFLVELTQMRVPVLTAAPASEGRSITLEDESTLLIDLDEPITLLEASDVVSVKLTATKAYRIEANVKREAAKTENINSLSVIDGQCGITEVTDGFYFGTDYHVAAVKKQIEIAVAMGVTDFTVVNQLAVYDQFSDNTNASTVVGEAIRRIGAANSDARISLTLSDAAMVTMNGFYGCIALQSVSAPEATLIGKAAFIQCTALQSVSASVAEDIEPDAFYQCTALQSVLAPAATAIGDSAFYGCSSLQSVSLGNVTTISSYAFQNTQVTTLNFDYVTYLGPMALSGLSYNNLKMGKEAAVGATITLAINAFTGCRLTGSVTFHRVVSNSTNDGLYYGNAFYEVATSELDLFLHAEQPIAQISVSNGKLMWAGAEWASITLLDGPNGTAGTKYYIDNGMPTVEVDGTIGGKETGEDADVTAMNSKIKVVADAAATTNVSANVIVKNGLAAYTKENATQYEIYAGTVVGEAIRQLTPSEEPMGTETVNYNGRITLTLDNATELPEIAFAYCNALQNVSAPNATEIGPGAFISCTALTSVTTAATPIGNRAFSGCTNLLSATFTSANTEIKAWAFSKCTNLEIVRWDMVTSIGDNAFSNCTALENVSSNTVTTVGNSAFSYCISLKTVRLPEVRTLNNTFSYCSALEEVYSPEVTTLTNVVFENCISLKQLTLGNVTSVNLEQYTHSFTGANTAGCALTLGAGQQETTIPVSASGGQLMWAGKQWQSITVGGVKYAAKGNELYAVIDGSVTDVNTVMAQIQAVPANTKILVTNWLEAYSNNGSAGTVVGEAIRLLTSQAMPTNTSEEDYIGSISLVLDDGITEIPYMAFMGCKELGSVVANGVTTIGIGAFYECTGIKELTFGQTFEEVGMNAFGLDRRENDYCWSNNCVLTLKSGQLLLTSGSLPNKYTSQGYEQVQEGNDKPWCDTAWKVIKLVSNTPQPI